MGVKSDAYYDLFEDYGLIVSSFQSQYGIRLSKELSDLSWNEFCDLLAGLGPDTPLGRIVSIRAEENEDILKHFSKEQHRIRNEWRRKKAKEITEQQLESFLESMKQAFVKMAGSVQNHKNQV
ncbi:MAG: Gp15 family bacteriophage protein [Lachnospiraceae bacterium]